MPVKVEKRKGKRPWKIVEKNTGKVVGSALTKGNAQKSANARNASRHGWKPTKR